jgi:hypothetical protein
VEVLRIKVGAGLLEEAQFVVGDSYVLELWQRLAGAFQVENRAYYLLAPGAI